MPNQFSRKVTVCLARRFIDNANAYGVINNVRLECKTWQGNDVNSLGMIEILFLFFRTEVGVSTSQAYTGWIKQAWLWVKIMEIVIVI